MIKNLMWVKKYGLLSAVVQVAFILAAVLMVQVVFAKDNVCNPKKGSECRCHSEPPFSRQGPARKYELQEVVANDRSHAEHDNDVYITEGQSCPAVAEPTSTPVTPPPTSTPVTPPPTVVPTNTPKPTSMPTENPTVVPTKETQVPVVTAVISPTIVCISCPESRDDFEVELDGQELEITQLNIRNNTSTLKVQVSFVDNIETEQTQIGDILYGSDKQPAGEVMRVVICLPERKSHFIHVVAIASDDGGVWTIGEKWIMNISK